MDRRTFLLAGASSTLFTIQWRETLAAGLASGTVETQALETLSGKVPLIRKSYRPPNYETPVDLFDSTITPNDRFFIRWHLSQIPEVDPVTWRLRVGGPAASNAAEYSLEDLKKSFAQVELVAVNQCSGNRRGLSDPHVPGVEWGYGAMGNARWKGVRLRDVLAKAGLKKEAVEIAFDGADHGVTDATPDFHKSLPVWKAQDENTLIVWEMNGAALPHLNGAPARLIVPGWTGTYWMKKLVSVEALDKPLSTFWMNTAYRVPKGKFAFADRFLTQENDASTPITEMVVNSLITNIKDGERIAAGRDVEVRGMAWDGGYGIADVAVSTDGGRTWNAATLGEDLGRFSFRPWRYSFRPAAGSYVVMARATNRQGATQVNDLIFNPPGYHNNVMQRLALTVA
ncbi:MAG TPA: molybdopterin-dependent oxidoreductase [Casimicrobiaceae bacterium]|nr:molybdopterin-dependent oxidoreductase [Casimicrobiaceae bacterium]